MKKVFIILMLYFLLPVNVCAYEIPQMQGEDRFNETVEEVVEGDFSFDISEIFNFLSELVLGEIRNTASDIAVLLVIAALSGTVNALTGAFGEKGGGEAAFFACFTLMSTAALRCFNTALEYGVNVIDSMSVFINKLSPILMIALIASGKVTSASTFSPVFSTAVYIISIILRSCLVPLLCFSAVLSVAGNINTKMQISNFTRVVRSVSKWLMAAVITVFTGISAVYGFSAPALDAVSAKAVKFAVGSMVPVVGNFLSDSLETVITGTRLMKNAVGVSGMVVMCIICITPIVKIGIMQLMLKLTASLVEPLTDRRISKMLWEISESVVTVFALVVMTAVLFLVSIGILLTATS